MAEVFASCSVLFGDEFQSNPGTISVHAPKPTPDGGFICHVEFAGVEKYSRDIEGRDGIHALDCALVYLNGIRNNSTDPEFFWLSGDSMLVRSHK